MMGGTGSMIGKGTWLMMEGDNADQFCTALSECRQGR